jgi:type I restriction enzyme S subunit
MQREKMQSRIYDYYGASGKIDKVDDFIFDDDLLLIAEDGANLVLRNLPLAIIARGKFWVNNHAHILKPRQGSLEYFAHLLESIDYRPWITGAAQPKLTQDRLFNIGIPVPPPDEQGIVAQIEDETRTLRQTIEEARRQVELAREHWTRLVSDVVMGKVDVRHLAPERVDADMEELAALAEDDNADDDLDEVTDRAMAGDEDGQDS